MIPAAAIVLTLGAAVLIDQCARRNLKASVLAHPPFRAPGEHERRQALGPTDGLPPVLAAALSDGNGFQPIGNPRPGDWLASQREKPQTFTRYVASSPIRPDAVRSVLYIQPLGEFNVKDAPSVDFLGRFAGAFFGLRAVVLPPRNVEGLGVTDRTDPVNGMRQLLTEDLRRLLRERVPPDAFAVLGVTLDDLYPGPSWNFVFGEASLTERVGVYSFLRTLPAFYNKTDPASGKLALLRSSKVLAHETGHLLGLTHCVFYKCLMNGSNHIGELDARPLELCPVCLRKVQWSVGLDVAERYRRLRDLAKEGGFDEDSLWLEARLRHIDRPSI